MQFTFRSLFPYALLLAFIAATFWAMSFERLPQADFTFINSTEIESVDPAVITGQPEGRIVNGIFEGLTRWDPKTSETLPAVAQSWEISEDGRVYTFHLRDDAVWSDGSPVTAHDFEWSFRRFLDPKSSGPYVTMMYYIKNAEAFNTRSLQPGDLVEVELHEKPDGALPFARGEMLSGTFVRPVRIDLRNNQVYELDENEPSLSEIGQPGFVVSIKGNDRIFLPQYTPLPEDKFRTGFEVVRDVLLDFSQVGIRAIDDRTFEITLTNPAGFFLSLTGFYTYLPVNPRCIETYGSPAWTKPENIVTNGPFLLERRDIRHRIRLSKSPTYWGRDEVYLNHIDALPVESATTAVNLYMTGQVDWIPDIPSTIISELLEQQRPDFQPAPELTNNYYRINTTRPPLDDKRVRQALSMAVNKQEIVDTVTRAGEIPALSLVPPGIAGYISAETEEFNPERARQLLAEAGFPGGQGFRKITILYNTHDTHQLVAELIQHQWKEHLGIDVGLQNMEWNSYLAAMRALQYDVCRAGWIGDYLDPNTFLDLFLSNNPNNQTGFDNPEYDKLVGQAATETDPAKRLDLLHQAETLLLDESPIIPLYYRVSKNMVRPYVQGFYSNLQDVHPLRSISIDEARRQRFLTGEEPW